MNNWQIDLFNGLEQARSQQDVMAVALQTVRPLGFDFCSWRSIQPLPLAKKKIVVLNSHDDNVARKASANGYQQTPAVRHCSQSSEPFSWLGTTHDAVFREIPELMEEYYSWGHRGGWAQSLISAPNLYCMLWVDSQNILTPDHYQQVDFKLQWITTVVLTRLNQLQLQGTVTLDHYEREILRWLGEGKELEQIGQIMAISCRRVERHLDCAMDKLDAPNETSAVVRAIFLQLLYDD